MEKQVKSWRKILKKVYPICHYIMTIVFCLWLNLTVIECSRYVFFQIKVYFAIHSENKVDLAWKNNYPKKVKLFDFWYSLLSFCVSLFVLCLFVWNYKSVKMDEVEDDDRDDDDHVVGSLVVWYFTCYMYVVYFAFLCSIFRLIKL